MIGVDNNAGFLKVYKNVQLHRQELHIILTINHIYLLFHCLLILHVYEGATWWFNLKLPRCVFHVVVLLKRSVHLKKVVFDKSLKIDLFSCGLLILDTFETWLKYCVFENIQAKTIFWEKTTFAVDLIGGLGELSRSHASHHHLGTLRQELFPNSQTHRLRGIRRRYVCI